MANKFYAVKNGKRPGIYISWDECEKQVKGFPNAIFKGFEAEAEAYEFLNDAPLIKEPKQQVDAQLYVDGSWNENKQQYGWGFVLVVHDEIVSSGYGKGNNPNYLAQYQVAGEVVSVLQGLERAIFKGYKHVEVVYDFLGIELWTIDEWQTKADIARAYLYHFKRYSKQIKVSFTKVKSHSGNKFNNEADRLAKKGASK